MIYYLGVRFSKETNQLLSESRILSGLSNRKWPKLDFHTTIVYSRKPFTYRIRPLIKEPVGIVGENVELLGKSLVLTYKNYLESTYIYDMYETCVENGAQSDYQIYKPHITIIEDCLEMPNIEKKMHIPIILSEIFYLEW